MESSGNEKSLVSVFKKVAHRIMNPPKLITAGKPFGVHIKLMKIYLCIALVGAVTLIWTREDAKKNRSKHLKLREQLTEEVKAELAEEKRLRIQTLARIAEETRRAEQRLAELKK